ncbi:hypothetical protein G6O67_005478 [Ophiocordyceps sinensis]|uniref:Uncharacterized protein n=1 Tax=Ophiocordyceps sinensis TaxID=72228 RepID=A0A8H4PRN9_9HYPO|nr:hypothetical protein G6O67_005478 [Ophiocordyceps sinensis]
MFRLNVPGYLPPPVEILSTKAVPRTSCWTALHSGRRKPIPPYITNYAAKVEDPTWKRVATAAEFLPTLKPTGEGDSSGADGHGSSGADGDPDWTLCLYCSESFEETGDSDGSDIIFMETHNDDHPTGDPATSDDELGLPVLVEGEGVLRPC